MSNLYRSFFTSIFAVLLAGTNFYTTSDLGVWIVCWSLRAFGNVLELTSFVEVFWEFWTIQVRHSEGPPFRIRAVPKVRYYEGSPFIESMPAMGDFKFR